MEAFDNVRAAVVADKLVKNARLAVYKGAEHDMCSTEKNRINADLLAFMEV